MINPGQLNKRVKFERVEELEDDEGSFYNHWTTLCTRWVNIRPVRGREAYINDQDLAQLDLVVTVRCDSSTSKVNEKDRINYSGRLFDIESVVNVEEKGEELRFFCVEMRDGN